MSSFSTMRRRAGIAAAATAALLVVAGCNSGEDSSGSSTPGSETSETASAGAPTPSPSDSGEQGTEGVQPGPAKVSVKPADDAGKVRPDQQVVVQVSSGSIQSLTVKDGDGDPLTGVYDAERSTWKSVPQLQPGSSYTVRGKAKGTDGKVVDVKSGFRTMSAGRNLRASMSPVAGMTVGVAMPIQVFWNHAVRTDAAKAAVEKRLSVRTSVPVEGSWHWNDDKQINWRPKTYWPAGTKVTVGIAIQGVDGGNGLWGAASRVVKFNIGRAVVTNVNVPKHVMVVRIDGKVARTIPVTAGKAGFTTRSGNKVVMEKYRVKRMDARTVGISPGDPEYYDIRDVPYAHRVTSSGEFVHGAYWSESSQGEENVSHGCVGMSVKDAAWYFEQTQIGDPIVVSGTKRKMEPGNGWTDWELSWDKYKAGSALS
jgi:lipoprotein-anchoring transpeptidase ErfK/SrfK